MWQCMLKEKGKSIENVTRLCFLNDDALSSKYYSVRKTIGEGSGTPPPVLLPGKSHGQKSLVGCSPQGCKESDTTERLHFHFSLFTFMHWRRKWQPTPVFFPGESQGWRSLVGFHLWGRTESDTTETT